MRGASTSDREARAQDEIARGGGPQVPAALGLRLECGGSPAYSFPSWRDRPGSSPVLFGCDPGFIVAGSPAADGPGSGQRVPPGRIRPGPSMNEMKGPARPRRVVHRGQVPVRETGLRAPPMIPTPTRVIPVSTDKTFLSIYGHRVRARGELFRFSPLSTRESTESALLYAFAAIIHWLFTALSANVRRSPRHGQALTPANRRIILICANPA